MSLGIKKLKYNIDDIHRMTVFFRPHPYYIV